MMVDQCKMCPEHGLVFMGDAWWCPEHFHEGVAYALRAYWEAVGPVEETWTK